MALELEEEFLEGHITNKSIYYLQKLYKIEKCSAWDYLSSDFVAPNYRSHPPPLPLLKTWFSSHVSLVFRVCVFFFLLFHMAAQISNLKFPFLFSYGLGIGIFKKKKKKKKLKLDSFKDLFRLYY